MTTSRSPFLALRKQSPPEFLKGTASTPSAIHFPGGTRSRASAYCIRDGLLSVRPFLECGGDTTALCAYLTAIICVFIKPQVRSFISTVLLYLSSTKQRGISSSRFRGSRLDFQPHSTFLGKDTLRSFGHCRSVPLPSTSWTRKNRPSVISSSSKFLP